MVDQGPNLQIELGSKKKMNALPTVTLALVMLGVQYVFGQHLILQRGNFIRVILFFPS